VERTPKGDEDDVIRALRMHLNAFRGQEREWEDCRQVLERLGDTGRPGMRTLRMPCQHAPLVEKALYRLECVGVLEDYTVRHGEGAFEVRLTGRRADEGRVREHLGVVYGTVEKARRGALREMVLLCRPGMDGEDIKRRIRDYLEGSGQGDANA
jgi:hypothetical protein